MTTAHNAVVFGLTEESWIKLSNVPLLLHLKFLNSNTVHPNNRIVRPSITHLNQNGVTSTMTTIIQSMDLETNTRKSLF